METPAKKSTLKTKLAATVLLGVVATGCAVHEGHEKHVNQPTLGAELRDLQKALDADAISEQEYSQLKAQIMDSTNR